jgi:hypothetical protein
MKMSELLDEDVTEVFQNDEANLMYRYNAETGRLGQRSISNHDERAAHHQGYRDSPEEALKVHGIIKSKFKPGKWVQKQGNSWPEVFPFGKPEGVSETASAGATSSSMGGTIENPAAVTLGKAKGKKSYTGTPGHSGTKAPPQPKVVQPKTSAGTAVNALDMKGKNIFGQAKESAVLKRR